MTCDSTKLWDEIMSGIDEKYAVRAAERLFCAECEAELSDSGAPAKEYRITSGGRSRGRFAAWLGGIGAAAAAIALIAGGVALYRGALSDGDNITAENIAECSEPLPDDRSAFAADTGLFEEYFCAVWSADENGGYGDYGEMVVIDYSSVLLTDDGESPRLLETDDGCFMRLEGKMLFVTKDGGDLFIYPVPDGKLMSEYAAHYVREARSVGGGVVGTMGEILLESETGFSGEALPRVYTDPSDGSKWSAAPRDIGAARFKVWENTKTTLRISALYVSGGERRFLYTELARDGEAWRFDKWGEETPETLSALGAPEDIGGKAHDPAVFEEVFAGEWCLLREENAAVPQRINCYPGADEQAAFDEGKADHERGLLRLEASEKLFFDGKKRYLEAMAELDDGVDRLADAKNELAEAEKELDDAVKTLSDSKAELERANRELSQENPTLNESQKQLDDAQAARLAERKEQLEAAEAQLSDAMARYDADSARYEAELSQYSAAQEQLDAAKERLDAAAEQIAEKDAEIEAAIAERQGGADILSLNYTRGEPCCPLSARYGLYTGKTEGGSLMSFGGDSRERYFFISDNEPDKMYEYYASDSGAIPALSDYIAVYRRRGVAAAEDMLLCGTTSAAGAAKLFSECGEDLRGLVREDCSAETLAPENGVCFIRSVSDGAVTLAFPTGSGGAYLTHEYLGSGGSWRRGETYYDIDCDPSPLSRLDGTGLSSAVFEDAFIGEWESGDNASAGVISFGYTEEKCSPAVSDPEAVYECGDGMCVRLAAENGASAVFFVSRYDADVMYYYDNRDIGGGASMREYAARYTRKIRPSEDDKADFTGVLTRFGVEAFCEREGEDFRECLDYTLGRFAILPIGVDMSDWSIEEAVPPKILCDPSGQCLAVKRRVVFDGEPRCFTFYIARDEADGSWFSTQSEWYTPVVIGGETAEIPPLEISAWFELPVYRLEGEEDILPAEVRLDIFEEYFAGEWSDGETSFTLSYTEDIFDNKESFCVGFRKADGGAYMVCVMSGKVCRYFVSDDDRDTMYLYSGDVTQSFTPWYTRVSDGSAELPSSGRISELGLMKLKASMDAADAVMLDTALRDTMVTGGYNYARRAAAGYAMNTDEALILNLTFDETSGSGNSRHGILILESGRLPEVVPYILEGEADLWTDDYAVKYEYSRALEDSRAEVYFPNKYGFMTQRLIGLTKPYFAVIDGVTFVMDSGHGWINVYRFGGGLSEDMASLDIGVDEADIFMLERCNERPDHLILGYYRDGEKKYAELLGFSEGMDVYLTNAEPQEPVMPSPESVPPPEKP